MSKSKQVTIPPLMRFLFKIRPFREAVQEIYLERLEKLSDQQWAEHMKRAHESGIQIDPDAREKIRESLKVHVPEGFVERLKSPVTYISTAAGIIIGVTESLSLYVFLPLSV